MVKALVQGQFIIILSAIRPRSPVVLEDQFRTAHVWTHGEPGAPAYNGDPGGRASGGGQGQSSLKAKRFLVFLCRTAHQKHPAKDRANSENSE